MEYKIIAIENSKNQTCMRPSNHSVGCIPSVMIHRTMHSMVITTTRIRHGFCPSSSKVSDNNNNNQMTMDAWIVTPSAGDRISTAVCQYVDTPTYQFGAFIKGVKQGNQEVDDYGQVE